MATLSKKKKPNRPKGAQISWLNKKHPGAKSWAKTFKPCKTRDVI